MGPPPLATQPPETWGLRCLKFAIMTEGRGVGLPILYSIIVNYFQPLIWLASKIFDRGRLKLLEAKEFRAKPLCKMSNLQ